jgi:hypothetical protein
VSISCAKSLSLVRKATALGDLDASTTHETEQNSQGGNAALSYVGEPFEYDVFVSYAHAEAETQEPEIRAWSRHVADRLRALLRSALNPTADPANAVSVFLDDHVLTSGQPLTETLRTNAQRSALLLVLMSPLYSRKSWCLDELEWFFTQAEKDGRGQQHCTVLRIQPLPDEAWPKRLRDERGRTVLYRDLVDPEMKRLPLGFDDFEAPALKSAIRGTFIEVCGRLTELRKQLEARRAYQQPPVPPVQPVLYLHARPEELTHWKATRTELEPRAIVNPDSLPEPATDDALQQRQSELRLREYALCDGIVLLRTGIDEMLHIDVMAAYKDRQRLYQQRRQNIPWAIIDRLGDAPPVYSAYRVPCVPATSSDWPDRLVHTLGLNGNLPP